MLIQIPKFVTLNLSLHWSIIGSLIQNRVIHLPNHDKSKRPQQSMLDSVGYSNISTLLDFVGFSMVAVTLLLGFVGKTFVGF